MEGKSFLSAPDKKQKKLTSLIKDIARDDQGMFVGASVVLAIKEKTE